MYYIFAAENKLQRIMERREIKLPVKKLKGYLNEVGIPVKVLAEMADINPVHLYKCLAGEVDERNGSVRTLSDENVARLQEALHQFSLRLKYIFIFYNTDKEVRKRNGRCYCPDCVEQIKTQLAPSLSILPFMHYALGWNRSKVRNVMDFKNSIAYGNISRDDVDRINVTLAEVATRLDIFILIKD